MSSDAEDTPHPRAAFPEERAALRAFARETALATVVGAFMFGPIMILLGFGAGGAVLWLIDLLTDGRADDLSTMVVMYVVVGSGFGLWGAWILRGAVIAIAAMLARGRVLEPVRGELVVSPKHGWVVTTGTRSVRALRASDAWAPMRPGLATAWVAPLLRRAVTFTPAADPRGEDQIFPAALSAAMGTSPAALTTCERGRVPIAAWASIIFGPIAGGAVGLAALGIGVFGAWTTDGGWISVAISICVALFGVGIIGLSIYTFGQAIADIALPGGAISVEGEATTWHVGGGRNGGAMLAIGHTTVFVPRAVHVLLGGPHAKATHRREAVPSGHRVRLYMTKRSNTALAMAWLGRT